MGNVRVHDGDTLYFASNEARLFRLVIVLEAVDDVLGNIAADNSNSGMSFLSSEDDMVARILNRYVREIHVLNLRLLEAEDVRCFSL